MPVIRDADFMSVRRLAERLAEVAEHARSGKLATEEVQGGTFTITNPGLFGTFSRPRSSTRRKPRSSRLPHRRNARCLGTPGRARL